MDKENSKKEFVEIKIPGLKSIKKNPWFSASILLVLIIVGFLLFNGGLTGKLSSNEAGQKLLTFYKENGAPQSLVISSITEESGLYQVNFDFQGQIIPAYITKDGKYAASLSLIDAEEQQAIDTNIDVEDSPYMGNADSEIVLIEFSDFACSACKKYHDETFPQIKEKYIDTNLIRYVKKDFISVGLSEIQEVAHCVRDQLGDEAYFTIGDRLYENQNRFNDNRMTLYLELTQDLGLNQNEFETCLESGQFASQVQKNTQQAVSAGGTGTPFFIVNGIVLNGAQPFSAFEQVIDNQLSQTE